MSVLNKSVLVLNRNWQAIHVATVARALVLLWNDMARVVDTSDYQTFTWDDWSKLKPADDEEAVQSTSLRLRVPEVITLLHYDKLPTSGVTFSRRNIFKRDKYVCQYCFRQPPVDELTIDHVNPRSKGGESSWTNCVLACLQCNKKKADRDLETSGLVLRKAPIKPDWRPIYAAHGSRLDSWKKFISDSYWDAELVK